MTQILLINAAVLVTAILILWAISVRIRDVSFIDSFWAFGMVMLALSTYLQVEEGALPRKALILLVYYVVYQQIENYVIAPRVMQRTVSVPGTVTIIAALAGGALLGILGALLAIPVAAGLLLIYEEVLVPRQQHA